MGSEASSQRNRRPAKEAPGNNLALPDDSLQRESLGCKWFHSLRVGRTGHFQKSHSHKTVTLLLGREHITPFPLCPIKCK